MKMLQIIKEEIVPLSSRQQLILLIIIACVFQFVLFYTPALADEAVQQAQNQFHSQDDLISNDSVVKGGINQEAAKLFTPVALAATPDSKLATSSLEIASSSPEIASSSPSIASSTVNSTASSTTATSSPALKVIKTSTHIITAYNSDVAQTDSDPCTTANGFNVCKHNQEDTIAANFLRFGTKVKIPELFGNRVFIVRDRMNQRNANRVDIWMKSYNEAINFGIKTAEIQVVE